MSASDISVIVEEPAWKKTGVALARVKAAARLALVRGGVPKGRRRPVAAERSSPPHAGAERRPKLTLLLTNDARLRALNAQFRGKDAATNVLSFPVKDAKYLGDIAIALGVTAREAVAAGISEEAHTLHLVVHGVLHLLGYDHVRNSEARVMEPLEVAILGELGIPSPYAPAIAAR